jgi:hypothetical protein
MRYSCDLHPYCLYIDLELGAAASQLNKSLLLVTEFCFGPVKIISIGQLYNSFLDAFYLRFLADD